jgi:hypothetical protein
VLAERIGELGVPVFVYAPPERGPAFYRKGGAEESFAIVGGFLATQLGLASQGGLLYTIIVAVLGAMLVTFIVRKIRGA